MAGNPMFGHGKFDAAEKDRLSKRDDGTFPRDAIDARNSSQHAADLHGRVKDAAAKGHFSQATADHVGKMTGAKK